MRVVREARDEEEGGGADNLLLDQTPQRGEEPPAPNANRLMCGTDRGGRIGFLRFPARCVLVKILRGR